MSTLEVDIETAALVWQEVSRFPKAAGCSPHATDI